METPVLSVTPEQRAEKRRKDFERKQEIKYLSDTLKVTLKDIEYALRKFKGSVVKAADFLGTTSSVLRRKIDMDPYLGRLQKDIMLDSVDEAEFKLKEQVEAGYFPAIAMTLKTIGKDRGYTERHTMEHEMSDKAIRDAAGFIEAMRRTVSVVDPKMLEAEEESWVPVEEYSHTS